MCKQPSQATWSEIQLIDVGNQGGYGRPFPGHVLGGNLVTVGLRFPPGPQTVGWSAPPGPQTVGLGNKGFATRWTHAESQQLVWSGGLRVEDAWTLMGFILGPCWIWVKLLLDKELLLDKALQRWVQELWGKELQAEKEVQSWLDEPQRLIWSVGLGAEDGEGSDRHRRQRTYSSRLLHAVYIDP